ncbi:MAG: DNA replication/repair protein RecF [Pseudomonadota bacterium]
MSGPIGRPAALAVRALRLNSFRNYSSGLIEGAGDIVVLTGDNGAGKTNILEALSLLGTGRGLRAARFGDVQQHGATTPWVLSASVENAGIVHQLGVRFVVDRTGTVDEADQSPHQNAAPPLSGKREIRLDGGPLASSSDLDELVGFIWLTPAMDRLFQEGVSARRRFFDRLVAALIPGHLRSYADFEQAMRERTRLLETQGPRSNASWLSALESQMAAAGVAVAANRVDALGWIQDRIDRVEVPPFPQAELAIGGAVETALLAGAAALACEDQLAEDLSANRGTDAAAGRATTGVHRSDFLVTHRPKQVPAAYCSTGEQKALLISIILAHAALAETGRGRPPILLLDEVVAHLDGARRAALFNHLRTLGGQSWLTGTDAHSFRELNGVASFYNVAEGVLEAYSLS